MIKDGQLCNYTRICSHIFCVAKGEADDGIELSFYLDRARKMYADSWFCSWECLLAWLTGFEGTEVRKIPHLNRKGKANVISEG